MPPRDNRNHDCPLRDVLDRIGDAWTFLVISELTKGPCRFNALKRVVEGISQRMLAVTLHQLQRDGLVSREVLDTKPPQVEYALTERGETLAVAMRPLAQWAVDTQADIHASRAIFDAQS